MKIYDKELDESVSPNNWVLISTFDCPSTLNIEFKVRKKMHNWFTVWNPASKQACNIYVVGSAIDGFLEEDAELIRAFFVRNSYSNMKISDTDELLDEIYDSGGIVINRQSKEYKESYIRETYKESPIRKNNETQSE